MCLMSAESRLEEGSAMGLRTRLGGKIPLPRTGGAPVRTASNQAPPAQSVKEDATSGVGNDGFPRGEVVGQEALALAVQLRHEVPA